MLLSKTGYMDDLGRIGIPKDIRDLSGLSYGSSVQIGIDTAAPTTL